MKYYLKTTGFIVLSSIMIPSFAANTLMLEKSNSKEKKKKELSVDAKAKNTFENTLILLTGSMVVAYSDVFRAQAQSFNDILTNLPDDEKIQQLDESINALDEGTLQALEIVMDEINKAFDQLEKENKIIYNKIFMHQLAKEGVDITEKYTMPTGFIPLSQKLSDNELKRYIIKINCQQQQTEDVVIKEFDELTHWFNQLKQELKADPEVQNFMQNLQKPE